MIPSVAVIGDFGLIRGESSVGEGKIGSGDGFLNEEESFVTYRELRSFIYGT